MCAAFPAVSGSLPGVGPGTAKSQSAWSPYVAILLAAWAVTIPATFGPVRTNDSFWIDWVWVDQFARELANGNLYPRWLPQSHNGLGSPVFYYYPPLAFYAASLFALVGFSTYSAIIATFFASFVASGVGMYRWLKPEARSPLLGALIFTIAPYHAYNLYARGALAESVATALLPFVMIGVRKLVLAHRGGFVVTGLAYAALIMSHLPLALLASLFLIGPYAVFQGWRSPKRLATIGSALAIGIALAGIYLVPAFLLEPYRDTTKLWHTAALQPNNWSFWNSDFRGLQNYLSILVISLAIALPLMVIAIRHRSRWALVGLVCVGLAIGAVPAVWTLPLLKSVQFPFRMLPIAEFALAAAMATAAIRPVERTIAWMSLLATTILITGSSNPPAVSLSELQAWHSDVPENLPPGERPYSWPSRWALKVAAAHRQPLYADGTTVMPIFQYPAWQVRCGSSVVVPTFAEPATKLLSYEGPPNCDLKLVTTPPEKLGLAISLVAFASLLMGYLLYPFRRPRS